MVSFNFAEYVAAAETSGKSVPPRDRKWNSVLCGTRREKVREWLIRIAKIARDIHGIHQAAVKKDKFSLFLNLMSAAGTVIDETSSSLNYNQRLQRMGYKQFVSAEVGNLIRNTLAMFGDPPTSHIDKKSYWKVERFMVEGNELIFHEGVGRSGSSGPYTRTLEEISSALSAFVRNRFRNHLTLRASSNSNSFTNTRETWLCETGATNEPYIGGEWEERLVAETSAVFDKGLNRSILLHGLPGTGKTTMGARLADKLGGPLFALPPSVYGKSEDARGALLEICSIIRPSVLLLDDLDRISDPVRLLSFMEMANRFQKRLLVVATANDITKLPDALRRPGRFDRQILVKTPSADERVAILKGYANHFDIHIPDNIVFHLADACDGLPGTWLREAVLRTANTDPETVAREMASARQELGLAKTAPKEPESAPKEPESAFNFSEKTCP